MKRIAVFVAAAVFCASAFADPVVAAYDEALASGRVALKMHKDCEKSIERDDMKPCKQARGAFDLFKQKSKTFLASVAPQDLFLHVTQDQMDDLKLVNKQIGQSMDYITAYIDAKGK